MHLVIDDVTKRFGSLAALDGIHLAIQPGTIAAIIGLNGAGKSTLLRCLAGLLAPRSGRILVDGIPFKRDDPAVRQRLMFLPDYPTFLPVMTLLEHHAKLLALYGIDGSTREQALIDALRDLDLLGLAETSLLSLSRGQMYKAALCAFALVDPELWLLDEPFASGMDPQGMHWFKEQARVAASRGRTILYTTQILEIAERFSHRIIVLDRGKVRLDLDQATIHALPTEGPGCLGDRLQEFRER